MARLSLIVLLFTASTSWARDLDKLYEKARFQLGPHKVELYIADDDTKRSQGLMYIEKMKDNQGMLFVFPEVQPLTFWMKNTLIPLNIGFLDLHGRVTDIQEMQVAPSLMDLDPPTYQSRFPAAFALEMNTGWFKRHGVTNKNQLYRLSKTKSSLVNVRLQARP